MSWVDLPESVPLEQLPRMVNERGRRLAGANRGTGGTTISRNTTTVVTGGAAFDPWFVITFADPFTVDAANGNTQRITLTADAVLNDAVGFADGEELTLRIQQNGTGGHTVTPDDPTMWELPANYTLYGLANRVITLTYKFDATGKALLKSLLEI